MNLNRIRIPRKVKKWKEKLYGGHATMKENIPFKPSWLFMFGKPRTGFSILSYGHLKVCRKVFRNIRSKNIFTK